MEIALFSKFGQVASKTLAILALLFLAACSPQVLPTTASQPTGAPATAQIAQQTATMPIQTTPLATNCTNPMPLTPALTEGPYFKAGSPERASLLESGVSGQKLVLSGYVLTPDCKPIAHALLDFWQADTSGHYDNMGSTLRGHQFSDAQGYYRLETIIPGLYPGRTEHIHVKLQALNGPVLTTQLFFPGVASNDQDSIYDPKMVIAIQDTQDGDIGMFNFVLSVP